MSSHIQSMFGSLHKTLLFPKHFVALPPRKSYWKHRQTHVHDIIRTRYPNVNTFYSFICEYGYWWNMSGPIMNGWTPRSSFNDAACFCIQVRTCEVKDGRGIHEKTTRVVNRYSRDEDCELLLLLSCHFMSAVHCNDFGTTENGVNKMHPWNISRMHSSFFIF